MRSATSGRMPWLAGRALALAMFGFTYLAVVGCSGGPDVEVGSLAWPPTGIEAPARVEWVGEIAVLQPRSGGRWLRSIAGVSAGRTARWSFRMPVAAVRAAGRVFTLDTLQRAIFSSRPDGGAAERHSLPEAFQPVAVAASAERVYTVDRGTGTVVLLGMAGHPSTQVLGSGHVRRCGGLAVAANGDFLLTDLADGAVVRVNPRGRAVARSDGGGGAGRYNMPVSPVEASDGTVWVLDTLNYRVVHLDAELAFLGEFGQHGDGSGHFALPKGLALDADLNIYVSDARFDVVQVFDPTGRLLLVIGGHGSGSGEFSNPAGVSVDGSGRVLVVDSGNRRVQRLLYRRQGGSS